MAMQVHHDAGGLVFNLTARGTEISFNVCRDPEMIESAYVRRGSSPEDYSYIALTALINKTVFDGTVKFYGGAWLADLGQAVTMIEVADWLGQIEGVERSQFYMRHFADLV